MDYKNSSNTGLIIVADCMVLSVEYIGNVHLYFNTCSMLHTCGRELDSFEALQQFGESVRLQLNSKDTTQ